MLTWMFLTPAGAPVQGQPGPEQNIHATRIRFFSVLCMHVESEDNLCHSSGSAHHLSDGLSLAWNSAPKLGRQAMEPQSSASLVLHGTMCTLPLSLVLYVDTGDLNTCPL